MARFRIGLGIASSALACGFFLACVGDDPSSTSNSSGGDGDAASSGEGGDAGGGVSEGGGGTDSGSDGADAGPPPSHGTFAWELHADRAGNAGQLTTLAVGAGDLIGVASDYTQATTIGTIGVPGSGARSLSFLLGADKTPKWAIGLPPQDVSAVAVDAVGNVYIAGYFQTPSMTLGSKIITNSNGDTDQPAGFYAKLSGTDGSVLWAASISGTSGSYSNCTSIAARGTDVVVGCSFSGPIAYGTKDGGGGTTTTTKNTASVSDTDIVVLVLDPADSGNSGRTLWSKHLHGTANDRVGGVAFDGSGNVIVSGLFVSPDLKVDTSPVATVTNTGGAGQDPFVVRFDGAGAHGVSLAKNWGDATGGGSGSANGIAVAPVSGDIVLCGSFSGATNFGQGNVPAPSGSDAFVLRIDSGGATRWAKTYGGSGDDGCNAVAVDAFDQVAIGGNHRSSNVSISGKALPPPTGTSSAHAAKLSASGDGLWAYAVNGTNATIGGIGVLSGGDIVYSGAFSGSTDLGNGTVQSATGGAQVSLFVVRRSP